MNGEIAMKRMFEIGALLAFVFYCWPVLRHLPLVKVLAHPFRCPQALGPLSK
jgi:hypothetical protein